MTPQPNGWVALSARLEVDELLGQLDAPIRARLVRRLVSEPGPIPLQFARNWVDVGASAVLLRRGLPLVPHRVRAYFAVCAVEGWRYIAVSQLAEWSGVEPATLQELLPYPHLGAKDIRRWYRALHAVWLLDVAGLPVEAVAQWMGFGRRGALKILLDPQRTFSSLGGAELSYTGLSQPGAFTALAMRFESLLKVAFGGSL